MGVKSYIDLLLHRNMNFGIGNLTSESIMGWAFFKVLNFEDIVFHYDLFTSLVGNSASSSILDETAKVWWELLNENGFDIIREEETGRAIQIFKGIYPPQLRMFMQYPQNIIRGNLGEVTVGATPTALSGGYLNGYNSPFGEPTELGEMFVLKDMITKFAWFNPEPATDWDGNAFYLKPELMLKMRRFEIKAYDPEKLKDKEMIDLFFSGKRACRLWSPGIDAFVYDLKDNYNIKPTPWPGAERGD